jgi:PAS domain S-box-containing protein
MIGDGEGMTASLLALQPLTSLVDGLPDGIAIVNRDGRIDFVNHQIEVLSGYSRQELIGSKVEMLLPKRLVAMHVISRREFAENPRHRDLHADVDIKLTRKDGQEVSVEIALAPIASDPGAVVASIRARPAHGNGHVVHLNGAGHARHERMQRAVQAGVIRDVYELGTRIQALAAVPKFDDDLIRRRLEDWVRSTDEIIAALRGLAVRGEDS